MEQNADGNRGGAPDASAAVYVNHWASLLCYPFGNFRQLFVRGAV